jgi:hypothetical protein
LAYRDEPDGLVCAFEVEGDDALDCARHLEGEEREQRAQPEDAVLAIF